MAEYLSTKEVARYLKLNEKKVYALVAQGLLPASRVSGKWLFPRHAIDSWVEHNTVYPATGLLGALLDDMLIIQGSDDWLFFSIAQRFQDAHGIPVLSSRVGSLAGLAAAGAGMAHLACCHVENEPIEKLLSRGQGCYLVTLFTRQQGLIYDAGRMAAPHGIEEVIRDGRTFALRQALSGTHRLLLRLSTESGLSLEGLVTAGPYATHLEVAIAIRTAQADVGLGIEVASRQCGLAFLPLTSEDFKLAIPVAYMAHRRVNQFLQFMLDELKAASRLGAPGYRFENLGHMEALGAAPDPSAMHIGVSV